MAACERTALADPPSGRGAEARFVAASLHVADLGAACCVCVLLPTACHVCAGCPCQSQRPARQHIARNMDGKDASRGGGGMSHQIVIVYLGKIAGTPFAGRRTRRRGESGMSLRHGH